MIRRAVQRAAAAAADAYDSVSVPADVIREAAGQLVGLGRRPVAGDRHGEEDDEADVGAQQLDAGRLAVVRDRTRSQMRRRSSSSRVPTA